MMAQHQRSDGLAVATQRGERSLAVIGMKLRRVGLALGQGAAPHPGRDRNREFSDIVGIGRPAHVANVRGRQAHALARRIRKSGDGAGMAEREWHSHVDHVGKRDIGFLARLLVEHRVRLRFDRKDGLAVDRLVESGQQAFGMGDEKIGQLGLVGAAAAFGDHRLHGLEAMRFVQRDGILRKRHDANREA